MKINKQEPAQLGTLAGWLALVDNDLISDVAEAWPDNLTDWGPLTPEWGEPVEAWPTIEAAPN